MAIVVDKKMKRRDIALSCKDLVVSCALKDISIAKLAKEAGIAKGSFYDYFENKEDLIFEIVSILMQEYNKQLEIKLESANSSKAKLKIFASFFYNDDYIELRGLYKEFVAISLVNPSKQMIEFQTKCYILYRDWLAAIIQEAVDNKEMNKSSLNMVDGLFATVKGLYISYEITDAIANLQEAIDSYIDTLFNPNYALDFCQSSANALQ